MRYLVLIALCLLIGNEISAQPMQGSSIGQEYFENGTKMFEIGDYAGADSLFSLALCSYKNVNVYFNRGAAKLYQQDTAGFCKDMRIAANKYYDQGASRLFNQYCCSKVDTNYYNLRYSKTDSHRHVYYEVIQTLKYDTLIIGSYYYHYREEKKFSVDYGCDQNMLGMNLIPTNKYAIYYLKDTVKYFYLTPYPIRILNEKKYHNVMNRAKTLLDNKYHHIKTENQLTDIAFYYEITFSDQGEITNVEYLGTFPEVTIGKSEPDIAADLLEIVKDYPKVKPAKFKGETVNFVGIDYVKF